MKETKLSTESYKGVRDFYPEDQFIQNYIFSTAREVAERFGYNEYNASPLESSELYQKSGEDMVREETYSFTDRGGRDVTIRPEMTPSLARMVAAKKRELGYPLRLFTWGNMFRYERPQRGRLREHFQFNVDIIGVANTQADIEVIQIASESLRSFGATQKDFKILINDRRVINDVFEKLSISESGREPLSTLIDKRDKLKSRDFKEKLKEIIPETSADLLKVLDSPEKLETLLGADNKNLVRLNETIGSLKNLGIENVRFSLSLMRGFDYYTGTIFEFYDTHPDNSRALFGGGRYDEILDMFGVDSVPFVGFGMGDVRLKDFLETHNLLPDYQSSTDLYICVKDGEHLEKATLLATTLRTEGLRVALELRDGRRMGDQIKTAVKHKIPFLLCVGDDEVADKIYTIKNLLRETETKVEEGDISDFLFSQV